MASSVSAEYDQEVSYIDYWDNPTEEAVSGAIYFLPDGLSFWIGQSDNDPFLCTLSEAWNISSSVSCTQKSASLAGGQTLFLNFNENGTILYFSEGTGGKFYSYSLSTPYRFDLGKTLISSYTTGFSNKVASFDFNPDGTKILLVEGNDYIRQFYLTTPYNLSTITNNGTSISTRTVSYNPSFAYWISKDQYIVFDYDNYRLQTWNTTRDYDIRGSTRVSYTALSGINGTGYLKGAYVNQERGEIYFSDFDLSVWKYSVPVTLITNVAPVVNSVSLTPLLPLDNDTLSVTCNATDADDDSLTYFLEWFKNDVSVKNTSNYTDTYSSLSYEDEVFVNCTAYDGTINSTTVKSNVVTINLSDYSLTAFSVSEICGDVITLNSTNQYFNMSWSASTSPASYPITYDLNISNLLISYSLQEDLNVLYSNESFNNSLPNGAYNTIVRACDNVNNCISDSCAFTFCVSSWVGSWSTCAYNGTSDVWGDQELTYTDSNNCAETYDVPIDNGTHRVCELVATAPSSTSNDSQNNMVTVIFIIMILVFIVLTAFAPAFLIFGGITTGFFSFFVNETFNNPTLFILLLVVGSLELILGLVLVLFHSMGE